MTRTWRRTQVLPCRGILDSTICWLWVYGLIRFGDRLTRSGSGRAPTLVPIAVLYIQPVRKTDGLQPCPPCQFSYGMICCVGSFCGIPSRLMCASTLLHMEASETAQERYIYAVMQQGGSWHWRAHQGRSCRQQWVAMSWWLAVMATAAAARFWATGNLRATTARSTAPMTPATAWPSIACSHSAYLLFSVVRCQGSARLL